jgi:hypothetical protein
MQQLAPIRGNGISVISACGVALCMQQALHQGPHMKLIHVMKFPDFPLIYDSIKKAKNTLACIHTGNLPPKIIEQFIKEFPRYGCGL